ncbi:MAG TPA: DMT family transporter [Chloroflexi bacterium]|nr:MAG: EamA family transporter [Chloroflexota bacterium]HDN04496.1 DMT family transporter [Chloroflexota bacterium]
MLYLGELAAILTSITYAANSALFTVAGRKVGAMVVNRVRLAAACLFLCLGGWILTGNPWPLDAGWEHWFWLGSSGIVGLVIGDAFLFQAFVWVGPRLSMLMMSLAPIIAAFVAWIILGESLSGMQIAGVLITLLGVSWVVLDKNSKASGKKENYLRGILYGLAGATGQGLGLVLAKPGLRDDFSPLSANFIRMFSACVLIWLITLAQKKFRSTIREVRINSQALLAILGGAFSGPFLGVTLSLFALQNTSIGVASTLMALPPIFLLPAEAVLFKEKIGWGSILGTGVALLGVAVLFLF